MNVAVTLQPDDGAPGAVRYRWDTETDILTAALAEGVGDEAGMSGSVELAGEDGSWVVLDVREGRIAGVEVAVWPDVRRVGALQPPAAEPARVTIPARGSRGRLAVMQMDTTLHAEADAAERTIHFSLGAARPARVVRLARDVLLELDDAGVVAGLWLLNVPPFPDDA